MPVEDAGCFGAGAALLGPLGSVFRPALAALIDIHHIAAGGTGKNFDHASARMLYEMAKRYDEWEGTDGSGSSCRGAIKGWYNMGVCDKELWDYRPNRPGRLSLKRAKAARENTIGA